LEAKYGKRDSGIFGDGRLFLDAVWRQAYLRLQEQGTREHRMVSSAHVSVRVYLKQQSSIFQGVSPHNSPKVLFIRIQELK